MVGKPNLANVEDGAALDHEREASMADEGGVSAAVMESEDPESLPPLFHEPAEAPVPQRSRSAFSFAAGVGAGLALGIWTYRRRR